jgi:acyl-ACP thioesterase
MVSEQHLDTNRHVNNAQYVLMAIDALSELGRSIDLGRLTVQYRSMALLGDVIVPRVHTTENGSDIELVSQADTAYAIVRMEDR